MNSRLSASSASDLGTWQSARYTLFVRVHSADRLQLSTSLSSYCKLYLGETPVVSSSLSNILIKDQPAQSGQPDHRTFLTKVTTSQSKLSAVWNEKFEIPVEDAQRQILSIRVKSQHQLISPAIGACAIQLKQLRTGQTVDQSFPLFKGSSQVGAIRLQLMLRENGVSRERIPVAKVVGDAIVAKKTAKKMAKQVYHSDDDEDDGDRRQQDSMLALERERRRLDDEEDARRRSEREREQQLALEKRRIEEKMEQLRREEDERQRLRVEEEERRRVAAEKLAAEQEEQRVRRQWEEQEKELARRDGYIVNTDPHDNQVESDSIKKKRKDDRPGTRRSTLSLRDMLDMVVQDALPSDSDDSESEELDTDDERELIRQIAKLKLQMKRKKKEARARLRESPGPTKDKVKVVYVYEEEEDQRRHKTQSFHDDLYARSPVAKSKKEKHSKSYGDVIDYRDSNQRGSGTITSLMPGEFDQNAANDSGKKDKKKKDKKNKAPANANNVNNNNNNNVNAYAPRDSLSLGQMVQAATSVATLATMGMDEETAGDVIPGAVDALQNLAPIGRFLGRKLHEATAKVAQMNERETPSYYF